MNSWRHRGAVAEARRLLVPIVLALAAAGCPSRESSQRPSSDAGACTRVGQTCEVSPNKLGSCVQRDNCTGDCLVCQSQH